MKNWKDLLVLYNVIQYLNTELHLKNVIKKHKNILFCSGCSKTKGKYKQKAIPKYFYVSTRLLNFYKYCETNNFNYGILSDKYGIHLMDEKLEFYDIHPSEVQDFQILGNKISKKLKDLKIDCIIYYNPSPLMSVPYFKMLNFSNIPYYYMTKRLNINKPTNFNLI